METIGVNCTGESGRRRSRGAVQLDGTVRGHGDVNRDHAVGRVDRCGRVAGGSVKEVGG